MGVDKNHISYSASDIEKYHRGELSSASMHAMERAALDDPFLADAMEGYAVTNENNNIQSAQADITDLQERIAARIGKKDNNPVIVFGWWKVAAVIIILLGAGWIYTAINSKTNDQGIVANNKKATGQPALPSALPRADSSAVTNRDTTVQSDLAINEKKQKTNGNDIAKANSRSAPMASAPVVKQSETGRVDKDQLEAESAPKKTTTGIAKADSSLSAVSATIAGKNNGLNSDNTDKKEDFLEMKSAPVAGMAISNNSFNGTVVDQSNKPIANATVQVPDLNKTFTTDNNGYFSFKAPDTAVNASIASAGFAKQNARLNNRIDPNNQIVLQPDSKGLNEVVVIGYGAQRKTAAGRHQAKDFSINVLDAEPSVDWSEYTGYLEKNKRVTEDTKDIHGDVVVSFVINNKNELTNFKIEKSLHASLDAEAIRLIKEGPAWKLLRGKKAKASLIVKF